MIFYCFSCPVDNTDNSSKILWQFWCCCCCSCSNCHLRARVRFNCQVGLIQLRYTPQLRFSSYICKRCICTCRRSYHHTYRRYVCTIGIFISSQKENRRMPRYQLLMSPAADAFGLPMTPVLFTSCTCTRKTSRWLYSRCIHAPHTYIDTMSTDILSAKNRWDRPFYWNKKEEKMAGIGKARQGEARRGKARQGEARLYASPREL